MILPFLLVDADIEFTLATILHELAHVEQFLAGREAFEGTSDSDFEHLAWTRAREWAETSNLDPETVKQIVSTCVKADMEDGLCRLFFQFVDQALEKSGKPSPGVVNPGTS